MEVYYAYRAISVIEKKIWYNKLTEHEIPLNKICHFWCMSRPSFVVIWFSKTKYLLSVRLKYYIGIIQ